MLRRDDRAQLLAKVPLFSACTKKQLVQIAAIADEIELRPGKVLTRQGGPGREFFVLLEGGVDVERDGQQINQLGAGDFFGEMGLISHKRRNATITTTSAVRALIITETNFKQLLRENPAISVKVLETVAERAVSEDET
jgi:CRP/FNR family cyclic AMP-dependent transcriptional regulator